VGQSAILSRCYPEYRDKMADCPTAGGQQLKWLYPTNMAMLILYSVEALLRLFVERMGFFRSRWNCLDFIIVFLGWLNVILSSVMNSKFAFLRFFRIARLLRVLRIFIAFRELYLLITGLWGAMKTIAWGGLMLFSMLTLWSIVVVDFIHPWNTMINYEDCDRCHSGFQSVMESSLTLFQQIVAGDSWGQISVPLILERPWTAFILISIMMTISIGLMNLILAVIVERAAEARTKDIENRLKEKEQEQAKQKSKLLSLCKDMDSDGNGTLSLEEFLFAYENAVDFRTALELMDIQREELKSVFKIVDTDGSGDVSYMEFCDQLHQIQTRDTRTMLTFIKLNVSELRDRVEVMITDVATLTKAFGEHRTSFRQSSELLEAIDGKLGEVTMDPRNVCRRSSCQKECSSDQALQKFSSPNTNGSLLAGSPTTKAHVHDASALPVTQQPVEVKFRGLFQQAQEMEQRALADQDNILLAKVEELIRLRETTRQDLALLKKELEWKLEASLTSELAPTVPSMTRSNSKRSLGARPDSKSAEKRSTSVTEDPRERRVSAWSQPRDIALCACTSVNKMPRVTLPNRTGAHASA